MRAWIGLGRQRGSPKDSSSNDLATSNPTSMPTRSISSNGPIRKPPPMRQMRSIWSCVARRSPSRRSPSPANGRPQRLTRKPGPSAARITRLPIASPASRASASARSPVWSARITSSSSISGGGLKKCMPTTFSGSRGRAGQRGHRDRAGVGGQHGVGRRRPRDSCGEQLALEVGPLGRGLDHQLAAGQAVERGGGFEQVGRRRVGAALGGPALEAVAHPPLARLERLRQRVVQQRADTRPRSPAARCRRPSCRRRRPRGSPPAELRRALLDERGHALHPVLGRHRQLEQAPLLLEPGAQRRSRRPPARPACRGARPAAAGWPPRRPAPARRRASPSRGATWLTMPSR